LRQNVFNLQLGQSRCSFGIDVDRWTYLMRAGSQSVEIQDGTKPVRLELVKKYGRAGEDDIDHRDKLADLQAFLESLRA